MHKDGVGRITVDKAGAAIWIVALEGEHDLSTVARLEHELDTIFAQGTTIVVDLSAATFMDSSVLRQLILAQRRVDQDADEQLAVVAPPGSFAERLFGLVEATTLFTTYATRSEALGAFGR